MVKAGGRAAGARHKQELGILLPESGLAASNLSPLKPFPLKPPSPYICWALPPDSSLPTGERTLQKSRAGRESHRECRAKTPDKLQICSGSMFSWRHRLLDCFRPLAVRAKVGFRFERLTNKNTRFLVELHLFTSARQICHIYAIINYSNDFAFRIPAGLLLPRN